MITFAKPPVGHGAALESALATLAAAPSTAHLFADLGPSDVSVARPLPVFTVARDALAATDRSPGAIVGSAARIRRKWV